MHVKEKGELMSCNRNCILTSIFHDHGLIGRHKHLSAPFWKILSNASISIY